MNFYDGKLTELSPWKGLICINLKFDFFMKSPLQIYDTSAIYDTWADTSPLQISDMYPISRCKSEGPSLS